MDESSKWNQSKNQQLPLQSTSSSKTIFSSQAFQLQMMRISNQYGKSTTWTDTDNRKDYGSKK
jgi:hypothetical protein